MSRVCCFALCLAVWLVSLAALHGEEAELLRTDLYGDPLPPGAVARLGTIRLRHAHADVAFSKDSKQLISCGPDGEVRVWDAASGKLQRRTQLARGSQRYSRVILSPDGAMAAAVQGLRLYLHDAQTGAERGQIDIVDRALVRFSADAAALVVESAAAENGYRSLEVWDVARVKKRQSLADASAERGVIESVFSRDGECLAGFTSARDQIFFWNARTGKLLGRKEAVGERAVEAIAYSPDDKTLAVAWSPSSSEKAQVQLLDAADYQEKAALPIPTNVRVKIFTKLAFSPDGRLLAGSYANDQLAEYGVLLWDGAGIQETRRLPERRNTSFAFAPDGKTLACHDPSGSAFRLWDIASGRQRLAYPEGDRLAKGVTASPNGKFLAVDSGEQIHLWDTAAGQSVRILKRGASSHAPCIFSPDSQRLIGSDPGLTPALQEWEVTTGKKRRRFALSAPGGIVHSLGISADGQRLAAVISNGRDVARMPHLFMWDVDTGGATLQRPFKSEGRIGTHFALTTLPPPILTSFAPDGESVIRMWNEKMPEDDEYWRGLRFGLEDVRTGTMLAELPKGVGLPVMFSPNGRWLAAPVFPVAASLRQADMVKELSLIEAASGEEFLRVESGEIDYLAFTSEGRGVIAANKKGVRVWDVETGRLLREMVWPESIRDAGGNVSISSLAVLPGGRLATAMSDGDILIWALTAATWPTLKADFERKPQEALWADLEKDARTAQRAIRALTATPAQTVRFLSKSLVPAADGAQIVKLLARLDSDSLVEREAASRDLTRIRDCALPRLRQELKEKPSLELRLRIEAILVEEPKRLPVESVRTLRAIDVLERIGTPKARRLLENLTGSAAAVETRAAKAALQRLQYR